jgi:O-antigen ligase
VALSWFSPQTLGGLLAMLAFAAVCLGDLRRGVIGLTAAGCIRNVSIGAFGGSETVQGLLPVEALASVLFAVWLVTRGRRPIRSVPFNVTLLLMLPISALSLIAGFLMYDPSIAIEHMKLSVSLGQILLTMWPIAMYLVVANVVHDTQTIDTIRAIIIVLALPSMVLMVAPGAWSYVDWSTSFALPASSFAFVECLQTPSTTKKAGWLLVTLAPAVYGIELGKAFYYGYVAVSSGIILWLAARRVVVAVLPLALAAYVIAVPLASSSMTPGFVRHLVVEEEEQQSLGGTGGRDRLILDGLGIWSRAPVLGVGPGNNYPYMLRYSAIGTAHNQYVNILMELGVVGLACFVVFLYQALRLGLRLWRTARVPSHRKLVLAWLGIFGGFLVGGFFGDFMLPSIRNSGLELFAEFYVQWIVLGLIVSASAIERKYRTGAATYVYA